MKIATVPVHSGEHQHPVDIIFHNDPVCPFSGKKLKHPFTSREIVTQVTTKQGKTHSAKSLVYDHNFVAPEVELDINHPNTKFYLKMDGSSGQYRQGVPRRRHDLKVDHKTHDFKPITHLGLNYSECEPKPQIPEGVVPDGFHWPHMRDIARFGKMMGEVGDKWYAESAKNFESSSWFANNKDVPKIPGEWMGPKIQGCESDPLETHTFVPFNMIEFVIPVEMRNYEGFSALFLTLPNIEGVIAYCPSVDGMNIYKIRLDMFIDEAGVKNKEWGKTKPSDMKIPDELKNVFDNAGARNFAEFLVKTAGLVQ